MNGLMKTGTAIKIGISGCLIGEKVRYDGGHKRNSMIVESLAAVATLIPICPEVELGMGVPRPPLALVKDMSGDVRMITRDGGSQDFTSRMEQFAVQICNERLSGISGYIFKARSPSCAVGDIPVHNLRGDVVLENSFGLYARSIHQMMPNLPITDEKRLATPADVDHFVERAFVYRAWLRSRVQTEKDLRNFHRQVRSHAAARCETFATELDQLVDGTGIEDSTALVERYIAALMRGLETPVTEAGHVKEFRSELEWT